MNTKKITLYYGVTPKELIPPNAIDIERKNKWVEQVQYTVPSEWEPKTIKVTYELVNPEVDQQRKFFNGPVVRYWFLQSQEREMTPKLKKQARTTLLDQVLGYDVELLDGSKTRERKSTKDFTDTQQWHNFLETLRETEFEPNGYEFPNSEDFNRLSKIYGHAKAEQISVEQMLIRREKKSTDNS